MAIDIKKDFINQREGRRRLYALARRLRRPTTYVQRQLATWALPRPTFRIPQSTGIATLAYDRIPEAAEVAVMAQTMVRTTFHDPTHKPTRKTFLLNRLDPALLSLDSPILRFALNPEILSAVSRYLGMVPILANIKVFLSEPSDTEPWSSQLFHCDAHDKAQVKAFVYCSDIGPENGPLTLIPAKESERIRARINYRYPKRIPDSVIDEAREERSPEVVTGPPGTVCLFDSSRCFHYGSRVSPGSTPRVVLMVQYLTPFAFTVPTDYRQGAPLGALADAQLSRVQRAVLAGE